MNVSLILLRALVSVLFLLTIESSIANELAITIDDSPRLPSPLFGMKKRAQKIRSHLKETGVEQVLFLATPSPMNSDTKNVLRDHARAGHLIGNHTHSHLSAHDEETSKFLADLLKAHHFLNKLPSFHLFFRFPFLREGATQEARKLLADGYKKLGYANAYVTIDTSEWFLEHELLKALNQKKIINYESLKEVYLSTLLDGAKFYSDLAKKYLGRDVAHTLLLHENEIAALYLGDLIRALKAQGWKIISPLKAYADPIAKLEPKTMTLSQGRVMALAIDAGYSGPIRAPLEELESLGKILVERKVFSNP